jgi:hypothetical protein
MDMYLCTTRCIIVVIIDGRLMASFVYDIKYRMRNSRTFVDFGSILFEIKTDPGSQFFLFAICSKCRLEIKIMFAAEY